MVDEPTNAELGRLITALQGEMHRRMDTLNSRLSEFVPQNVYAVQTQYFSERLAQMQADVRKASDANEALENAFEQYQRDERDRRERDRQSRLYQAIIPIAFGVLTLAVAVWAVVVR